jgi:8-oxo-dGTP pyrophosphatase MutT (NUDIX family)
MEQMSDLRADIRESVLARRPSAVDDRERLSIERFIEQFDLLERPFDEDSAITHVTGSAIVVGQRGVLLHLHKRAQIWIQPGGHVDTGETPWDGARRETLEETGLLCEHPNGVPMLIHVDVHDAPKGHIHLDLRYLLLGPNADPAPPEGESQDVAWCSWDDHRVERDSLAGAVRSAHLWMTQQITQQVTRQVTRQVTQQVTQQ